jgi:hypothetical protein
MSWYSTPLQPLDPVVVSQQPKPNARYMRDNFAGTGQNSYVKPPAQDQSAWQLLLNVQPITQGILNQRWGYVPFVGTLNIPYNSTVTSITLPGHGLPRLTIATATVASTVGLVPGSAVLIAGNTDNYFNGIWVVATVVNSTTFTFQAYSGYTTQTGTGGTIVNYGSTTLNRLFDFQSDSLGTRAIIATSLTNILAYTEQGTLYNGNIFTPVATSGIVRSITSRNFQYFCDGINALNPTTHLTGDSLKWNGSPSGGVSNIGIVATDVTTNSSSFTPGNTLSGPNPSTVATDQTNNSNPWTNPNGVFSNSLSSAAYVSLTEVIFENTYNSPNLTSDSLQLTGFNFTSITSPSIAGVQVNITYAATFNNPALQGNPSFQVQLVKYGSAGGTTLNTNITADGNVHTVTLGSATSLWGSTFAPGDITNPLFGVQFYATSSPFTENPIIDGVINANLKIQVQYVTVTVYLAGASGTSNTSGNGVGILGSVGNGAVSLTLGRTYYLVPNNSLTGHFGDLSTASGSSGACADVELNLVLATYNDPQVNEKYVLATADGGDPSILYEVGVLVPGFIIASWAIVSNVVTFTGTFQNGTQLFSGGTSVTVGGLSHGDYLNNITLVVTSATPTTFSAPYTAGNDSATEIGVAAIQGIPGTPASAATFAIPNAVTFVIDNTPDPILVTNQPLLFTDNSGNEYGVTLNDPPPNGTIMLKHQGRLWMTGVPGSTHSIFFSKSVSELTLPNGFIAGKYEESWPGSNYFDVSDGAESVSGLLSDGTTLYIGTQNHIRRLIGNSPATFQEPQIIHPEVGLLNQEVWQIVFMQGAPSGSVWLTPDFRVIQSDFNTYVDIGTPIQDILNKLQSTATTLAHAAFVADGEYELYILAVPYLQSTYCDTHLVFDLRARQWFVWQPAGGSLSLLYNVTQQAVPQALFIPGAANAINLYSTTATTDNGISIPVTATTTWMNMGEPTRRKLLNEIQVYGNTGMLMSVYGANNLADFLSTPRPVVYNRALKQSPFGTWNLYLTGDRTKYRYYQFSFNATNGQIPFLGSYAISMIPMDDL